ncbi:MAG: PorT family protein [Cytophagales bacterium]|nr:PorT family protein [Cytophagales bacterium]
MIKITLKLLVWITFLTGSLASYAQEVAGGFSYGIKLGPVVSSFSSSQPHTGLNLGVTAGGFAAYQFSDLVAIQAEVAYFQQGGSYVQFIDDTRFGAPDNFLTRNVKDANVILHNVYIPLQAKITPFSGSISPSFLLGPYADINFAATESYERTGVIDGRVYTTASGDDVVTDQYEMFQFGAAAGFQFEFPFQGDREIVINGTYKYGITPIKESYSYIDFNEVTEDITSNAFALTIGIQF